MSKNIEGVGEVMTPATPKEKIQNFWYHYKWHSLVALVLIIALLVCTLQFCGRTKYDAYIMYAGSKSIGRTQENGNEAEIETVRSALKRITDDFDGSGDISVNFSSYYFLSKDEEATLGDVNDALLANDRKAISGIFEHSEYYLCFISKAVYEEYHRVGDEELFIDLRAYGEGRSDVEYYADNAILLSSLGASKLPGIANLPNDTLICIRCPSVLGGKSKEHKEHLENAKTMLVNLLNIKIG